MRRPVVLGLVAVAAITAVQMATSAPAGAALPGAGLVTDAIGGLSGWTFGRIAAGVASWVLGGVAYFVDGVLNFLKTSARPQVDADWFAGPGSPMATVRNLAGVLLGGFVFLGLLQGLVRGDPGAMVRRFAADVPLAVLGMVATVAVVARLLDLTDALSTAVLDQADGQALRFLSGFAALGVGNAGFAMVVVGLVAIVAALVLWVELLVRSALVYLLVAVSPVVFAAMVWPAARGVLRRTTHLLLAVILSKFVIALALAVGVAALGGRADGHEAAVGASMLGTATTAGNTDDPAAGLGSLLVGGVILALAAFAPFIVLRLIPIAEAALVAQGVSHSPARAAHSGIGTYYYANSLSRLGGAPSPRPQAFRGATPPSPTGPGTGTAASGGAGAVAGAGAAAGAATATRAAGRKASDTARQAPETATAPRRPDTAPGEMAGAPSPPRAGASTADTRSGAPPGGRQTNRRKP